MRVSTSTVRKKRHKKWLERAKGYHGGRHRLVKVAMETVPRGEEYAFRGRKERKRDFRSLWILRINAACRQRDLSYSRFISGLSKADIRLNRKQIADVAVNDPVAFDKLVAAAKEHLG